MTYATLEQRQEAREMVAHSGKFEGESPIVPIIHDIVMNGFADAEADDGDIASYSLVGRWILMHDDQGFVRGRRYDSRETAAAIFVRIEDAIEANWEMGFRGQW